MTRPAKVRAIALLRPPRGGAPGVFRITVGDHASYYTFREIPCAIGGRGFAVHRLGLGELYHVRVGRPADCSCDCKGFIYRDDCRHVRGFLALTHAGLLPRP